MFDSSLRMTTVREEGSGWLEEESTDGEEAREVIACPTVRIEVKRRERVEGREAREARKEADFR